MKPPNQQTKRLEPSRQRFPLDETKVFRDQGVRESCHREIFGIHRCQTWQLVSGGGVG